MCMVGSTAILISLLFNVVIRYLYQGTKLTVIDWDMATVTAGDYAVEIEITKESYENWKNTKYEGPDGVLATQPDKSPALALKEHMMKEICFNLDDFADKVGTAGTPESQRAKKKKDKKKKKKDKETSGSLEKCAIADIVFSFNNRDLILALKERGSHIALQNFDKIPAADQKVQELFLDFDKLTIPTSAFVVFESDDFKELALDYEGDGEVLG